MVKPPRLLRDSEIEALLALDVPARLASLDRHGFPHVTPLWFVWAQGSFFMTSFADRPHVRRLARDPRAGLCIDVEEPERSDGQRPNRQVRAVGDVEVFPDHGGQWTGRITQRYVRGPGLADCIAAQADDERMVICLRPTRLVAVASV